MIERKLLLNGGQNDGPNESRVNLNQYLCPHSLVSHFPSIRSWLARICSWLAITVSSFFWFDRIACWLEIIVAWFDNASSSFAWLALICCWFSIMVLWFEMIVCWLANTSSLDIWVSSF